jgi:uncharacterized membrane protein
MLPAGEPTAPLQTRDLRHASRWPQPARDANPRQRYTPRAGRRALPAKIFLRNQPTEWEPRSPIGNTQAMTAMPPPTRYHRWLGWHAPAMHRTIIVGASGLVVAAALLWSMPWGMAVVAGWDVAAVTFLLSVWPIIIGANSVHAAQLAKREDENRGSATALLLGASVASLLGVGFALSQARGASGTLQVVLIGFAVLTVVLSWTVVNTVFTLRYADLHFGSRDTGIAFGDSDGPEAPTYRDFAYVAFTIGMCYQVSDTTIRDQRIRRTVLSHALLSYVFGAAIVGGSVNLIAGLIH